MEENNKDTPQSNTDWREEFDTAFKCSLDGALKPDDEKRVLNGHDLNAIKSFISQLLEAEKKRWYDEQNQK